MDDETKEIILNVIYQLKRIDAYDVITIPDRGYARNSYNRIIWDLEELINNKYR